MADRERIEQVLTYIENLGPNDGFDMDVWWTDNGCGTTSCFAGWVVPVSGAEWVEHSTGVRLPHSSQSMDIVAYAADWLDLSDDEADQIFYATHVRSLSELREVIDEILSADDSSAG